MRYAKPTDLLSDMDSHGIYDAAMLGECEFDTSSVPTFTPEQTQINIEERGLGGTFEPTSARSIYGWTTARALAVTFAGRAPGDAFNGRGSSFRANLRALKDADK
jgi:hypothetical protein